MVMPTAIDAPGAATKEIGTGARGLWYKRKSDEYPNYRIIKIGGLDTEKSLVIWDDVLSLHWKIIS